MLHFDLLRFFRSLAHSLVQSLSSTSPLCFDPRRVALLISLSCCLPSALLLNLVYVAGKFIDGSFFSYFYRVFNFHLFFFSFISSLRHLFCLLPLVRERSNSLYCSLPSFSMLAVFCSSSDRLGLKPFQIYKRTL